MMIIEGFMEVGLQLVKLVCYPECLNSEIATCIALLWDDTFTILSFIIGRVIMAS